MFEEWLTSKRRDRLWVILPLAGVLLPHAVRLPTWVVLSWLGCALISLTLDGDRPPRALPWFKGLLALVGMAGIFLTYGNLIGPTAGVALLAFLSGAKLLEMAQARDRLGLLFIGCFLLVAYFLTSQAMGVAAYMAAAALALTAALVREQAPGLAVRPALRQAGLLLLQALPLALLLFVLFPRLQAPLWGLPHEVASRTGLSDHMRPGDIGELILSDELALRAEFAGVDPPAASLYWRGPVLWDFDGRVWRNHLDPAIGPPHAVPLGAAQRYTVTLEAHQQHWLFLLGLPTRLPDQPEAEVTADLQWLARQPVTQRLRYTVETHADYQLDPELGPLSRRRALALPPGNLQARELARSWQGDDTSRVRLALAMFREQPFHYTLRPPPLGEDAIDTFLFQTRRGFCEHYASAFVFLMRAAGVPARVVTGYQGGEFNALGRYWMVRGRDAHAWTEVWLAGRGWVRVDPTAAVSPARVERGVGAALPAEERGTRQVMLDGAWVRPLRLGWDLANQRWNQWVLGYDHDRQTRFLQGLSPMLASLQGMVSALAIGGGLTLATLAGWLFLRRPRDPDPARRAWLRSCTRMEHLGLKRAPGEAPEAYARRVAEARPDLGAAFTGITRLYLATRYGEAGDLTELQRAVRDFRPQRQKAAASTSR